MTKRIIFSWNALVKTKRQKDELKVLALPFGVKYMPEENLTVFIHFFNSMFFCAEVYVLLIILNIFTDRNI
jgi:hypothetical protein